MRIQRFHRDNAPAEFFDVRFAVVFQHTVISAFFAEKLISVKNFSQSFSVCSRERKPVRRIKIYFVRRRIYSAAKRIRPDRVSELCALTAAEIEHVVSRREYSADYSVQLRRTRRVFVSYCRIASEKTAERRAETRERRYVAYRVSHAFFEFVRSVFSRNIRCQNRIFWDYIVGRYLDFRAYHATASHRAAVADRRTVANADALPYFCVFTDNGISYNAVFADACTREQYASFNAAAPLQPTAVAYHGKRSYYSPRGAHVFAYQARLVHNSARDLVVFGGFKPHFARQCVCVA